MSEDKLKWKRLPWYRLLAIHLRYHRERPLSYRLRKWLFDMVRPVKLTALLYEGMFNQGYCSIADPDTDFDCWGQVYVDLLNPGRPFEIKIIPVTSPKTCSETSHQST